MKSGGFRALFPPTREEEIKFELQLDTLQPIKDNIMRKMTKSTLASFITLPALLLGSHANADTLASGNIYGGTSQVNAFCYLFNAGTGPVTISSIEVKGHNDSGPASVVTNGCSGTLAAGAACQLKTGASTQKAYSCKAVITPDASSVRGHMDLRNSSDVPLAQIDLR